MVHGHVYNTDVLKVSTFKTTRRDDNVVKMVRFSAQFVLTLERTISVEFIVAESVAEYFPKTKDYVNVMCHCGH